MASSAAESPLETVTRAVLVMAGLAVQEQVRMRGVGRVDLVVERTVAVEADGWQYHQSRDAFERDRARDRSMLVNQLPVMRFTSRELNGDLAAVVAQVAAVVDRAPHRDLERRLAWSLRR
jgi:very-short-patch-repair endonuclease